MKIKVYILFIYLIGITALPSVRAMKLQFVTNCEQAFNNAEEEQCENGNFVMNLNFSPTQFVAEISLKQLFYSLDFPTEKQKSNYEKIFISKYQDTIWHPPKYFI
jgi:hypothetical protein